MCDKEKGQVSVSCWKPTTGIYKRRGKSTKRKGNTRWENSGFIRKLGGGRFAAGERSLSDVGPNILGDRSGEPVLRPAKTSSHGSHLASPKLERDCLVRLAPCVWDIATDYVDKWNDTHPYDMAHSSTRSKPLLQKVDRNSLNRLERLLVMPSLSGWVI